MAAVEGRNLVDAGGGETNKERREQLRHLQKEAFQLANYYFVYPGVIFTAFYNFPSALKCHLRAVFSRGVYKPVRLSEHRMQLCKYKTLSDDIDRIAVARDDDDNPAPPAGRDLMRCERFGRSLCVVCCMAMFVGFLVITLVGSWKITCRESWCAAAGRLLINL